MTEQILEAKSHKVVVIWLPASHLSKLSKSNKQDMLDTVGEVKTNSWAIISPGLPHTDE